MIKGKEPADSGKFKSFGELINVANESGAIRSFGEYLSRVIPTQPLTNKIEEKAEETNDKTIDENRSKLFLPAEPPEEPVETQPKKSVEKEPEPVLEEIAQEDHKPYRVIKDKTENFECTISVEGAALSDSQARIILESDSWNFTFYGKIGPDGKCVVPIKKGIPLPEGAAGTIKLEVIADDQLFVGWTNDFVVETSKKVKVALRESKSVRVTF